MGMQYILSFPFDYFFWRSWVARFRCCLCSSNSRPCWSLWNICLVSFNLWSCSSLAVFKSVRGHFCWLTAICASGDFGWDPFIDPFIDKANYFLCLLHVYMFQNIACILLIWIGEYYNNHPIQYSCWWGLDWLLNFSQVMCNDP